jgi:hypothetical protein
MAGVLDYDRRDVLNDRAANLFRQFDRASTRAVRRRLVVNFIVDAIGHGTLRSGMTGFASRRLSGATVFSLRPGRPPLAAFA